MTAGKYKAIASAALLVAALAGIWRGVGSCGGYAWHGQVAVATVAILSASVLLLPRIPRLPLSRRTFLAIGVAATFVAFRALAVPFYPSAPDVSDYPRQVVASFFGEMC